MLKPAPYDLLPEFEILAVDESRVTLPLPDSPAQFDDTLAAGRYGLVWEGGNGVVGEVLERDDSSVTRPLTLQAGEPPAAGDPARMDTWLYRANPQDDLGLPYRTVTLTGEAGPLHAWWLPQDADTAVLLLHGRRRGDLAESLRILPALHAMGYSILALNYRNHGQSAASSDGFYHYGSSEWADALVALEFLASEGVSRVVLYGFSMGGAVALETLERWPPHAPQNQALENQPAGELPQVLALVLDSPLLDPHSVIRLGARNMGLPLSDPLADLALFVARLRAGVDWAGLDQRESAGAVTLPVLLIAGTGDTTVPVELADSFASRLPQVEYRRLEGVEHVAGWNRNPAAYEGWVRAFLQQHAPPSASR